MTSCTNCLSPAELFDVRVAKETLSSTTALLECPQCHQLADPWIELDRVIISIDLLLNRPGVYRHLTLNDPSASNRRTAKLYLVVVVADICALLTSLALTLADLRWSDEILSTDAISLPQLLTTAVATALGWLVYVATATALGHLLSRRPDRARLIPYALALSVLASLGARTFALTWRGAFRDSASTLPRNTLEHLGLLDTAQRLLDLPASAFVLREAELKWLLINVGIGGSAAVCAVNAILPISSIATCLLLGTAWAANQTVQRAVLQS